MNIIEVLNTFPRNDWGHKVQEIAKAHGITLILDADPEDVVVLKDGKAEVYTRGENGYEFEQEVVLTPPNKF